MWWLCWCVGAIVCELSKIYIVMKNVVWFSFLVMVAALWSCGGKVTDDVRADRPDTIVMKLGPDSTLAVIGKASTAERLQLVLKFQNEFPDTVNVALPDALKPKKTGDGEKAEGLLTVGKVVIAKISREESGEYVLHGITDVTEPYLKACERYIATWTTPDSIAVELTIAQGGKASVQNAKKDELFGMATHWRQFQLNITERHRRSARHSHRDRR